MRTATLLMAILTLTACDNARRADFGAERADEQYQSAMADYTAGRYDAAIDGFERVVRANPGNASARFQLAVLLQDRRQDYLGAVCNYRDYLLLAPESDKAATARDRSVNCERLLAQELARKHSVGDGAALAGELKTARENLATAEREQERLRKELEKVTAELALVKKESAQRKALIDRFGADEDEAPARPKAQEESAGAAPEAAALADRVTRAVSVIEEEDAVAPRQPHVTPVDGTEQTPKLNPEALALNDEIEREESARLLPPAAPGSAAREGNRGLNAGALLRPPAPRNETTPRAPREYVVKEGETLSQIALAVYGRKSAWTRIQEANKATVPINGSVRAGQVLVLP